MIQAISTNISCSINPETELAACTMQLEVDEFVKNILATATSSSDIINILTPLKLSDEKDFDEAKFEDGGFSLITPFLTIPAGNLSHVPYDVLIAAYIESSANGPLIIDCVTIYAVDGNGYQSLYDSNSLTKYVNI